MKASLFSAALLINSAAHSPVTAFAFTPSTTAVRSLPSTSQPHKPITAAAPISNTCLKSTTNDETESSTEISKAPTLNGKMVLPLKAMLVGLKGHKVAAVYALLNKNYKRGSGEGWEHVQYIGITKDLTAVLTNEAPQYDTAHVRALSFTYPQKAPWKILQMVEREGAGGDY
ncbi:hypothetical protein QTG54_008197 [Skeletonema marinoi]|uniref:Uncharacterized protein n=1 Tax=Skeletonema marinoi TaxID=267567 RepID=A0AAD8Y9J3_9STRA|nr:hypothetical protein QTG54_008197 [Skeletonema marinoi]